MRRIRSFFAFAVLAVACNEVFGFDAGKPGSQEAGGSSGVSGVAGSGRGGNGGTGLGSSARGGVSGSSSGGEAGTNDGAGAAPGGGMTGGGGAGGDLGEPSGAGGVGGPCSSVECRTRGFDLCRDGACADIRSNECDTIIGDEWIEQDPEAEPFILGALARFDSEELEIHPFYWNLRLAMQEFSEFGRIPIRGAERRPILLLCHGPADDGGLIPLQRGLNHMVGVLGASSVLMLLTSRSEVGAMVDRTLNARFEDAFFLDFGGATSDLLILSDIANAEVPGMRNGRLWHMLGNTELLAFPFVPLVERIEERVNPGASVGRAVRPTRLAFVTGTGNAYDQEIERILGSGDFSRLRINGALMREQPERFRVFGGAFTPAMAEELAAFAPDIVLDFSGRAALEPLTDEAFRSRSLPPPFYILPPERSRWQVLLDQIGNDPSLRERVVGVNFASAEDPALYRGYVERLRAIAPEIWDRESFENVYDAVYFLIYSAVAGGVGGTAKAEGFLRLIVGPRRDIGPASIESVLTRLSSSPSATLSLHGPSGAPDFHPPTGGRVSYGNVWCVNEQLEYMMDELRYDRALDDFTGTLSCFDR